MKYAIVTDSSIGLTKAQTEKLGWHFLPLNLVIDGVNYADGIDITSDTLFEKFTLESNVKSSMFNMQYAIDLFTNLSKEYDMIFVYPISQHLSNSYQALKTMEKDFDKLRVIQSKQVMMPLLWDVIWFDHMLKTDSSKYEEYINHLENPSWAHSVSVIPKYNRYLVKGGRLHPAAALVARMLKLVPIIKWEDGQLMKENIGRNFEKTVLKNLTQKHESFKVPSGFTLTPVIIHQGVSKSDLDEYKKLVHQYWNKDPMIFSFSPVIEIHTGPETHVLGLMLFPTDLIDVLKEKLSLLGLWNS
ncbi:DegV family protein [Mycoplasmopsis agalactiae]|uniref:DegV family protein n=1 Tax=Mycoplasmopsis agalactiae TaxID=2110 RepID=UPI00211C7FED|nr:DegV family protein [Mycoplasmopsis agalactiae]UUM25517.1 DegV family protein [Mycoplasmopsis agalactiae]